MVVLKQRNDGFVEFKLEGFEKLISCTVCYRTAGGGWKPAALYKSACPDYIVDKADWRYWNNAVTKGIVRFETHENTYSFFWNKYINIRNYRGSVEFILQILGVNGVQCENAAMDIGEDFAVYLDNWLEYAGIKASTDEKQAESRWYVIKDEGGGGVLTAKTTSVLPEITIYPGIEGLYSVYVCLKNSTANLHIGAGNSRNRSKFLLGGDFMSLFETNIKDKLYKEIKWKDVDFGKDTEMHLSQVYNDNRVLEFGNIAYIKLVPVKACGAGSTDAVCSEKAGGDFGVTLYFEPYSYAACFNMTTPGELFDMIEDFNRLSPSEITFQVVRIGSRALHHSNIVDLLELPSVGDDLKVYNGGQKLVKNMDVLDIAVQYCKKRGIFFTANLGVNRPYIGLAEWTDRFVLNNMDKVKDGFLDYTHPEVMDYAIKITEEIVKNYDVDGLSFDFMRTEENQTKDTLIEFMRRVRQLLENKRPGAGFDRRLRLTVRIPAERIEYYEAAKTWADEDLVDIIVPSNAAEVYPLPRIEHYVNLCKGSRTKVYGCIDGWKKNLNLNNTTGTVDILASPGEVRSLVKYYRDQGASGVFFYQGDVYALNPLYTVRMFE